MWGNIAKSHRQAARERRRESARRHCGDARSLAALFLHTRGNTLLLIEVSCPSVLIDKRMPYQGLLVFMKFIQLHGVGSEIIHLNEIKYGT